MQSQCSAESLGDSVVLPTPSWALCEAWAPSAWPPGLCAHARHPFPLPRARPLSIGYREALRYRGDARGSWTKGQKAEGGISQSKGSKWKCKTCAQPRW